MQIRSFFLASLMSVCALALTNACSGSSNSGGSGNNSGGTCNSVASTECNKIEQCAPAAMQEAYGDVQTCITRVTLGCKIFTAAPGGSMSSAQLSTCSSSISQMDCTAILSGNFHPAGCPTAGTLANGAACFADSQCQSGYCNTGSQNCGTCAGGNVKAGSPCTANTDCQGNLACINKSCAQPVASGGSCSTISDCASGLACVSGKCGAPLTLGQPCTAGECGIDAYCGSQKTCEKLQVAASGQPCGIVNGNVIQCSGGGSCNIPQGKQQGTCAAPIADGAKCDATNPNCLSPAQCINGTCSVSAPTCK